MGEENATMLWQWELLQALKTLTLYGQKSADQRGWQEVKSVEKRTCYKAKYLVAQLLEMKICELEAEVKLILARLQMNKNVRSKTGLTSWKTHTWRTSSNSVIP